jgi:NAD(P)-dependent dehydrogenase (short-subunit alcohol dehydrogenase family)
MADESQRTVVIVGASGGIGAACLAGFREQGWHVIATSTSARTSENPQVNWRVLDLTSAASVRAFFDGLRDAVGSVDAVVFAVGAPIDQPYTSKATLEQWREAHTIESEGAFLVSQGALGLLRESGGCLTYVTSSANRRFSPGDVLSAAPKASVEALCRAIAVEEGKFGVRANCVAVGVVEAGMFLRLKEEELSEEWLAAAKRNIPLRRFGAAEDVADSVVFLSSARAKYVTGQILHVDGGYSA